MSDEINTYAYLLVGKLYAYSFMSTTIMSKFEQEKLNISRTKVQTSLASQTLSWLARLGIAPVWLYTAI